MRLDRTLMVKVHGRPAPKGSLRPVGKNRRILKDDNPNTEQWRRHIAAAGRAWRLSEPLDGPLGLEVTITLARPASIKPSRRPWPHLRSPGHGDIDKLARTILDGLQDAGVFHDDAQVCELVARKGYPDTDTPDLLDRPGAVITIYPISLDDETEQEPASEAVPDRQPAGVLVGVRPDTGSRTEADAAAYDRAHYEPIGDDRPTLAELQAEQDDAGET
jgi:crossover junction endodeoxyribonuclease RusA